MPGSVLGTGNAAHDAHGLWPQGADVPMSAFFFFRSYEAPGPGERFTWIN